MVSLGPWNMLSCDFSLPNSCFRNVWDGELSRCQFSLYHLKPIFETNDGFNPCCATRVKRRSWKWIRGWTEHTTRCWQSMSIQVVDDWQTYRNAWRDHKDYRGFTRRIIGWVVCCPLVRTNNDWACFYAVMISITSDDQYSGCIRNCKLPYYIVSEKKVCDKISIQYS